MEADVMKEVGWGTLLPQAMPFPTPNLWYEHIMRLWNP
jgi:hypothetical protein